MELQAILAATLMELAGVSLIIRFSGNQAGVQVILAIILLIGHLTQGFLFGFDFLVYIGLACWVSLLVADTIRWSNS